MNRSLAQVSLLALFVAGCGASPEEYGRQAQASYAAHNFSAAREALTAKLVETPGDTAAREMLARSQIELGDGEGGAATLALLAKAGKLPADGAILRGEAELQRGQPKLALAAVKNDTSADAWRVRALAAIAQGDVAAATTAFAKGATAMGPAARLLAESARFALLKGDHAQARALLAKSQAAGATLEGHLAAAQLASSEGRFADALKAYAAANSAWPENRAALVGRVAALGDLGRTEEMATLLNAAAKRAPDDIALVYLQARLAAANSDWKATRAALQPSEARLAQIPPAQLLYAQALTRLGQAQQAQAHLKGFLAHDPANRTALRLLGEARLAGGDSTGALETLRPLAIRPDASTEELVLMARAAGVAKSPDAAEWQAKAKAGAVKGISAQLALADSAMKRRDWVSAVSAYRGILAATDGKNAVVLNNLAYATSRLGNRAEALATARKALAVAPDNASVLDTAGWIMVEGGDETGEGLTLLRKAARLAPTNVAIADHLAKASRGTPSPG